MHSLVSLREFHPDGIRAATSFHWAGGAGAKRDLFVGFNDLRRGSKHDGGI